MIARITICILLLGTALAPPASAEDLSTIQWQTNYDDPPIGDPAALVGGTFYTYMQAYPLTLRLVGPNANDAFASVEARRHNGLHARDPPPDDG